MNYDAWRITFQSSEAAAKAAFKAWHNHHEAWEKLQATNNDLIQRNITLREKIQKLKQDYNKPIAEIKASAIEEAVEMYSTETLEGPICYSESLEYHASIIRSEAEI